MKLFEYYILLTNCYEVNVYDGDTGTILGCKGSAGKTVSNAANRPWVSNNFKIHGWLRINNK